METLGLSRCRPSAPSGGWASRDVHIPKCRDAELVQESFSATLLAMAGHDLRQPLQLITSAHDILALTLDGEEQQQELMRAADATAQLASMLGQLVEALQLRER